MTAHSQHLSQPRDRLFPLYPVRLHQPLDKNPVVKNMRDLLVILRRISLDFGECLAVKDEPATNFDLNEFSLHAAILPVPFPKDCLRQELSQGGGDFNSTTCPLIALDNVAVIPVGT
jgi:hypothetical protein